MASHIRTRSRCFSVSHSLPSTLGARRIFGRPRASSPACSERWEMVTARRHSPSRENTFTFGLPPLVSSPREQRRLRRATRHSSAEARPLQTLFQSFLPPKTTVGIVPFSRWALSSASFVSREATRAFRPFTVRPSFSRTSEGAPLFRSENHRGYRAVLPVGLELGQLRIQGGNPGVPALHRQAELFQNVGRGASLHGSRQLLHSLAEPLPGPAELGLRVLNVTSQHLPLGVQNSLGLEAGVINVAGVEAEEFLAVLLHRVPGSPFDQPGEGPPLAGAKKAHLRRQGGLVTTGPAGGAEGRKCFREKLTGYRDDQLPLVPLRHGASAPEIPGALSGLPWPRTVARKTT